MKRNIASAIFAGILLAAGFPASSVAQDTKMVAIFDPSLGVNYYTYSIPADWVFQGAFLDQTSCSVNSSPYFRTSSPDGLTGDKVFPRFDLAWSTNPAFMPKADSDCLAHEGEIPVADYLKYVVGLLHVEDVRDATDPAAVEKIRTDFMGDVHPGQIRPVFADQASVLARFNINSIKEEEEISATEYCMEQNFPRRNMRNDQCSLYVEITWAPEGKVLTTVKMLQSVMHPTGNPEWMRRWGQRNAQQWAEFGRQMTNANNIFYQNLNRQIIANGQATRQQMDSQFQTHEAAMAAAQRGSDMNLQRQEQHWNNQQRMADDACDYALGLQKRYDPTTGQLYKSSSAYSYDWISSDGTQHYPTNDINDNPNGRGSGNWTLTNNVH